MREGFKEFEWAAKYQSADLIQLTDLTGCLHNHSTYSDGKIRCWKWQRLVGPWG